MVWTRARFVFAFWLALSGPSAASEEPLGGLIDLYDWPEDPRNLVLNPSFEEVAEDGSALHWKVGSRPHWILDPDAAHSGRHSLQLRNSHEARFYPLATQRIELEPGWYNLRTFVRADNAGVSRRGSGARLSLRKGRRGGVATPIVRGTTDWKPLERNFVPVEAGDATFLRLEAYRKPDGRVFFDDVALHRLEPPPVEGFLLYPNYRGALFQDESQTIRMSVTARAETSDGGGSELSVRLSLEDPEGKTVASTERSLSRGVPVTIPLDAGRAPTGRLRLRLQAIDPATGEPRFEYPSYAVVKLPPGAKDSLRAYVDAENRLVLDGKPRFALGIYDTSGTTTLVRKYVRRISRIAEAPFNLYLNYWMGGASKAQIEALTTALDRFGMSYLHTVNAWYEGNPHFPKAACGDAGAAELGEEAFTVCQTRELGAVRGLAGWYTADEQPADVVPRVFEQYRLLRENDPDGVTFIAQNRPGELVRWRDAADVVGVDPYPIVNLPEGELSRLEKVADWVRAADDAVEGSRPVWAVIQFFQIGKNGHFPTYDELRSMSYLAIVNGAEGLFYWSYGARALSWVKDAKKKEEYWQRLVRVTREIAALEPVLLAEGQPSLVESISHPEAIQLLVREHDGSTYLFAVNRTGKPVEATFRLSRPAAEAEVVDESRSIAPSGGGEGGFTDRFQPYQAHVYRIASRPPG